MDAKKIICGSCLDKITIQKYDTLYNKLHALFAFFTLNYFTESSLLGDADGSVNHTLCPLQHIMHYGISIIGSG